MPQPGILLVLDGWGIAEPEPGNAIARATTPNLDALLGSHPVARLDASGSAVGLPDGVVGNSEIGHLVIGAGRPLEYDSLLVARQVESGHLQRNPALLATCQRVRQADAALHLVGLCSDGQIHSHIDHVRDLLTASGRAGLQRVWIHAITDGRDVADNTAVSYLEYLVSMTADVGVGALGSVVGRGYAMDKSGNRQLTETAYLAIAEGVGKGEHTTDDLIHAARASSANDQWIEPTILVDVGGRPRASVRPSDALIFTNFRSDRTQQLADMMLDRLGPTNGNSNGEVEILSMTQYDTARPMPALVLRADASHGLADELEAAGVRSVHVAEAEKFEHVTYFLNGRDSRPRPCQEHILVPGRADGGYEASPAMNAEGLARQLGAASERDDVDLIVANLANIDVVGHTGNFEATVQAVEAVDAAIGTICACAASTGRWVALVGDHGNGEQMLQQDADGTDRPYGGHTANQVPFVVIDPAGRSLAQRRGQLPLVAPTALQLLGLPAGSAMAGTSMVNTDGQS